MKLLNNWDIVHLNEEDRFMLSSTSKGNQIKWYQAGKYYKADSFGYEGLAEVFTNIVEKNIKDFEFVDYSLCEVMEGSSRYIGCYSRSFLRENESFLSFMHLLELSGVDSEDYMKDGMKNAFKYICDYLVKLCDISVAEYLARTLYFDAIICNEDRHLNNIGLIMQDDTFYFAPYFDNGLALLSDVRDYPLECDFHENLKKVKAKPFLSTFDKQVKTLNQMGFTPLKINYESLIKEIDDFSVDLYDSGKISRCRAVVKNQLRKYEGVAWTRL